MASRTFFGQSARRRPPLRCKPAPDEVLGRQESDAAGHAHADSAALLKRAQADAASLSPADVAQLRGTIGNRAVQRLLTDAAPDAAPAKRKVRRQRLPETQTVSEATQGTGDRQSVRRSALVQRDITSDIALDSPEFWTHMRSRTFTRLVAWIGDSRQKLNEFVAIMGDTDSPSPWGSVALSWIQVLGTAGDVVSAMTATLQALAPNLDSPSTLFEFRNKLENNLDGLSTKVNDLSSDLPIYALLRRLEAEGGTTKRSQARADLERALDNLPSPTRLKQELVQRWLSTATTRGHEADIFYETSYSAIPADQLKNSKIDTKELRGMLVQAADSDYFVGERKSHGDPMLRNVQRPEQTIKALRNAYDSSAPIHTMPLDVTLHIWIYDSGESGSLGGTPSMTWKKEADTKVWAPVKGLGSELQDAVMNDWIGNGYKPTLGELVKI